MSDPEPLTKQRTLVDSLASALERQGHRVQLFETHISWVIVAGDFAFKFKKAVRFDFLDFSTLARRRYFCEEELRLNRRLAPDIYLDVVAVAGTVDYPEIEGQGNAIEYAVRMRAFKQEALWTYRIKHRLISSAEIDGLANVIAGFHEDAARASHSSDWGTPEALHAITGPNLAQIRELVNAPTEAQWADALRAWDDSERRNLSSIFTRRKDLGFVRECHGDLHSANILTIDGHVEAFDCIEFNDSLRWIDVMNDIAFTCTDLKFQERNDLAARFLNQYLEVTGDYAGLAILQYYEVQRALVRCKVSLLRASQLHEDTEAANTWRVQGNRYLALSFESSKRSRPAVIITRGYSGSGKTSLARALVEASGAIQLRSDVQRKRMHGLPATYHAAASPATELYDATTTRNTYERLRTLARHVVESGRRVIVDAAFLKAEQRASFQHLAAELEVPFLILDLQAEEAVMRERIARRESLGTDASDAGLAVLAHQIANNDSLSLEEAGYAIPIDMNPDMDAVVLEERCRPILQMLESASQRRQYPAK